MGGTPDAAAAWAVRLARAGAPARAVAAWRTLRAAVVDHQRLLRDEGIGVEVDERDRVRVNARRVGLQAPLFADETDFAAALAAGLGDRGVASRGAREAAAQEAVAAALERVNARP
jgi:hypothetical protein